MKYGNEPINILWIDTKTILDIYLKEVLVA